MSIAVINFLDNNVPKLFADSLLSSGFAVLENHPVPQSLIEELYAAWYDFFQSDEKHSYPFDEKVHDGFVATERSETAKGHTVKDIKEFYHYYLGRRCPESLRALTDKVFLALENLAHQLLTWVEQALPSDVRQQLSMPLTNMIDDSTHTLFRIIHYPPLVGDLEPGAIRAAAHEDINLLTLLPAASAKGLQLQLDTGEWVDVPAEPGWMIINVGDMLAECTAGFYRATPHRVINPSCEYAKKSRVSSPLFLHPREDVVLSSRHTAASYFDERMRELGLL
jgi:isopenicillin N synthase-like dioxygenase